MKIACRNEVDTDHLLQLFDSDASRAASVAHFVREGLAACDTVLLVLAPAHWTAAKAGLAGVDLDAAEREGRLTVRDATLLLHGFMHRGVPEYERFDASVGAHVRQLIARGRPLRVYGEMVDVLAIEGDFDAARELETLWNQLAVRHPFTLFCGYSAISFGDPRTAHTLRALCNAHTRVRSEAEDVLGSFLLEAYR